MLKKILLNERIIFYLILVNSFLITTLYFPKYEHNETLVIVDHIFLIIFSLELYYKIRFYGFKRFWKNGWNKFDFFLVIFSLPAIFHTFVPIPEVSILLVFRLLRIFRVIRFFQFIPRIDTIFSGLSRALKSSVFVIFSLVILNFLFALLACQFFRELSPDSFGDPMLSFYSIFQSFTIEGWNEIPKHLVEQIEQSGYSPRLTEVYIWLCRMFFVVVVITGGMLGMSLANAIFVDEMTMDNNKLLEEKIDRLNSKIDNLEGMIARLEGADRTAELTEENKDS